MFKKLSLRSIPNALTVARILLTPLMLVLLVTPTFWAQLGALSLFMIASVSDYLDGVLARRMGARSRFGQFLDPMADKILVLGTFITLSVLEPQVVPWWAVLLIALRDLGVTALRSWAESHGQSLRTLPIAKWKTSAQLLFLFLMLVTLTVAHGGTPSGAQWILEQTIIPFTLLMALVGFTLYTGALYVLQVQSLPQESSRSAKRSH
jgi:CDP-diacylglycerol--glycerol-3-phosphate 3-phosphatidyltransferase